MRYFDFSSDFFLKITYSFFGCLTVYSTYLSSSNSSSDTSFSDFPFSSISSSKRLIQISPKTDPVLAHVHCVMNRRFSPPLLSFPDLSAVSGQFNSYVVGGGNIAINPKNDNFMVASFSRDRLIDGTNTFFPLSKAR